MVAQSSWLDGTTAALRPPPKLSLSEWADEHFRLSSGSADAGRWVTRPYQREILDALIDPTVEQVSVIKGARIGWTEMVKAATAYFMREDPCTILGVLPTVDIAEIFSREMLAPMLREVPALAEIVKAPAVKTTGRTLLHKALALDTPIATPTGWTTVADLQVGDRVFDEGGRPTRISHITEVFRGRPCYRVRFSDRAEIVCDADHAWAVERWRDGAICSEILSTEAIAGRVRLDNRYRYAVRNAEPLDLPDAQLPLDPYVLGAWLGDGMSHRSWICSGHHDAAAMATILERCGCTVAARKSTSCMLLQLDASPAARDPATGRMTKRTCGVMGALRELGILGRVGDECRKRIPEAYLRAGRRQRIALLQGLMDTDGSAGKRAGVCVFLTSNANLAKGFEDLLAGLGLKWGLAMRRPPGSTRPAFAYTFFPPPTLDVFRLPRKADRLLAAAAARKVAPLRAARRRIVAVDPVDSVPVKCITVEAASHLFLAGRQMVPTHNSFPGGVISLVGANSAAGFSMLSRRLVWLDEVDRFPPSAGDEGDPVALAVKRAETYWNRKILAGSTPTIAGVSRIEQLFEAGDQRLRYWPCPHCGYFDFLVPSERGHDRGHVLRWPTGRPDAACFECRGKGCVIEEIHKRDMDEAGEWRPDAPWTGDPTRVHKSFRIWSAYSTSPNAGWGQIATEFVEANKLGAEKLRVVVNTTFGETWQERGEAPEWELLYQRREPYQIGTVPSPAAIVLTAGVDVQKDRLVPEVVAWAANRENWSVWAEEIHGNTALLTGPDSPWVKLDELLSREFHGADGRIFKIARMAVDGGWQTADGNTQVVYAWGRQHSRQLVMITKGVPGMGALIEAATPVDVTIGGKKIQRGYRVWPVRVDIAKGELYGNLRLVHTEGDPPPGYCHFPEHPAEYFKQLTAEHLMTVVNPKTRKQRLEWRTLPNRENHALDARVLARVAAAAIGIDRMAAPPPPARAATPAATPQRALEAPRAEPPPRPAPRPGSFLGRPRGSGPARPGGWLGRRR